MAHKNYKEDYKNYKKDRQTKEHTRYNTKKKLPNMKYILDKLIIMSVKSDLCVMCHSVKSW